MKGQLYYIAHVLPEAIHQMILPYKEHMLQEYGCRVGLKSPAHITLVPPFTMDPAGEEALVGQLDALAGECRPFTAATQDLAAFSTRTIYVDIRLDAAWLNLKARVDGWLLDWLEGGIQPDTRPFHPHVTIATRDMEKEVFQLVWKEWKDTSFLETWQVDSLSLLKHNAQKNWDVYHTSQFVL